MAGICGTDLEILKGYAGYRGIPGHEFVGEVVLCGDPRWTGKRVAGEINIACGKCAYCREGLGRHCMDRKVLGIRGLPGCMAEFCTLPEENLVELPGDLPDERAVFLEPLSAACEILEQVPLRGREKAVVLGDGRLGILCAWVLSTVLPGVSLVGHHREKLDLAKWRDIVTGISGDGPRDRADLVVDATGSPGGIAEALRWCRPRGTVVLKTTSASKSVVDLAPLVVDEITVVGSRCGPFRKGLAVMTGHPDMPLERLVTATYPLEEAPEAFRTASKPGALKVLLRIDGFVKSPYAVLPFFPPPFDVP
jgi:alcohol dehydrogenase